MLFCIYVQIKSVFTRGLIISRYLKPRMCKIFELNLNFNYKNDVATEMLALQESHTVKLHYVTPDKMLHLSI